MAKGAFFMAVYHQGAISFGLVHIPVSMYTATRDDDIRFNQMHKADGGRIGYKKICKHCGKEVDASEIVKAFEFEKDKFVTIEENEFLKLQTEKDKSLTVIQTTNSENIPPLVL